MFIEFLIMRNSSIPDTAFRAFENFDFTVLHCNKFKTSAAKNNFIRFRMEITDTQFHAVIRLTAGAMLAKSHLHKLMNALKKTTNLSVCYV